MRYPLTIQFFLFVIISSCSNSNSGQIKEGYSSPSNFTLIEDVVYGQDFGMALTFDVYVPTKPNGAGIILTNSGGWTSPFDTFKVLEDGHYRFATDAEMTNSETWHVLSPKQLVSNGYTVFEVRHGSQPKFVMPEIVSHVRRSVRFIKHNSKDYGVDKNRIGLWGGSASGHLSLLIGLSPEIPITNNEKNGNKEDASIAAIVVFAAPSDLLKMVTDNPKELEKRPVLRMEKKQYQEFSPVNYATMDDPPTLIMHGNTDKAVPIIQGELMYSALKKAGVTAYFIEFKQTNHSPTLEQASKGVGEALDWFNKYLGE
ncbi:MAG: putative esterase [Crocinitomix sp.]|jgi:predicted esterase